jgi:SAM-dependent methyltransferase
MATLEHLPDQASAVEPEELAGPEHPMRKVTRGVAFEGKWNDERARKVADLFDGLAAEWTEGRGNAVRTAPLLDALDRGGLPLEGHWLELGSGTGVGSRIICEHVPSLVCTDIAAEMLRLSVAEAPRFRSDASSLPMSDDVVDVVVMINMLLFPAEVDRVLRPDGAVLWINTNGDQTPIHLPPEDVLEALPGAWSGTTSRAGTGFWLVARRS